MSKPHIKTNMHQAAQQPARATSHSAPLKWLSAISGGVRMAVQIAPNAKKTEVIAVTDDALRIRLHAQPIDGKANEALIRFLADTLDVPKSAVQITHGFTAKRKLLEVRGPDLSPENVEKALKPVT